MNAVDGGSNSVSNAGRWWPGAGGVVLGFSALLGLGCAGNEGRAPVYPVTGQVKVANEIPEGALVVLYPSGPSNADLRPSGKVKQDGSFTLTTYDADDGAPAGDYVATIQWNKTIKRGNEYAAGPNVVPPAYATQDKSPWKIHVAAGATTLEPLNITK